jgi:hypothetical protein
MVCSVTEPLIYVMHNMAETCSNCFNILMFWCFNIVRFDWFYNILYTRQPRYCGVICEPIS